MICADIWNPALPWLAALSGADVLLVPIASALDAVGGDCVNAPGLSTSATIHSFSSHRQRRRSTPVMILAMVTDQETPYTTAARSSTPSRQSAASAYGAHTGKLVTEHVIHVAAQGRQG